MYYFSIVRQRLPTNGSPFKLFARLFSDSQSDSVDRSRSFNKALRNLYMTVHPDRAAAWPSEVREDNARSFSLLQSFISQSKEKKEGEKGNPDNRSLFPLVFHIPTLSSNGEASMEASSSSKAPELKRVQMTLLPPSPAPESSPDGPSSFSPSTQRALSRLLVACGLLKDDPSFHSDVYSESLDGTTAFGSALHTKSLSAFLPRATEALRQHLASNKDASVRIANLRGALRMMRGVRVSLGSNLISQGHEKQIENLLSLIRLLDRYPDLDMGNLQVVIGSETQVDKMGRLMLEAGGDAMEWEAFLTQVDSGFVRERAELVKALREMEASLASGLGLGLVHTLSSHLTSPDYRSFLEKMIHYSSSNKGFITSNGRSLLLASMDMDRMKGSADGVRLCILPSIARHHGHVSPLKQALGDKGYDFTITGNNPHTASSGSSLLRSVGSIFIADDVEPSNVHSILSTVGHDVLRALSVKASLVKDIDSLRLRVRKALRLRRLSIHPMLVAMDEKDALADGRAKSRCKAACLGLLERAGALNFVTEGSSLLIGFTGQVIKHSISTEDAYERSRDQIEGKGEEAQGTGEAVIEIPYDFED